MKLGSLIIVAIALSALTPVYASAQGLGLNSAYVFGGAIGAIDNCACPAGMLHVGGGGEVMLSKSVGKRTGFRVEVRDYFLPGTTFNLLGARFGVVFR